MIIFDIILNCTINLRCSASFLSCRETEKVLCTCPKQWFVKRKTFKIIIKKTFTKNRYSATAYVYCIRNVL